MQPPILLPSSAPVPPPRQRGLLATLGGHGIDAYASTREVWAVLTRTLYYAVRGKRDKGALVRQMYEIGNRSALFLTITMGFIGMILVYQAGLQTRRVVPDFTMLGATYIELLVRDLAASIGALMLATRVGAGIAAEIGSMVVTEQVDAMRMCAAEPIEFLLAPRFVASVVMTTVLIVWSAFVATLAGAGTAHLAFGVSYETFFNYSLVDAGDLITGFAKCVAYGAAIPVVSGYCGLSTFGGSEGVGSATTRAVVSSSLVIVILDFLISGAAFVVFPK